MLGPLRAIAPQVQTVRIEGEKPTLLSVPTTREYLETRFHVGIFWVTVVALLRSLRRHKIGWLALVLLVAGYVWLGSLVKLTILLAVLTALATVGFGFAAPRYGGARGAQRSLLALSRKYAVERQWPVVCQFAGLTVAGGAAPVPISRVRTTPTGVKFTAYPGKITLSAADVSNRTAQIASAFFATGVRVTRGRAPLTWWERLLGARPVLTDAVAEVQIDWGNPLERVWRLQDLPQSPRGRVVVGLDEEGKPVTLSLFHSILIGGLTGSGKSNLIWAMLAALLLDGVPFRVYVIDPAEGMELSFLDPRQGGMATKYEDDPGKVKGLLREYRKAVAEQGRRIRRSKERKLEDFTPDNPLLILIIDEALLVDLDMSPAGDLVQTVVQVRKYGGAVWAATQVGTVDALKRLRDAITQRVAFALPTREQTDAVLGERAYASGANCPGLVVAVEGDEDEWDVRDDQRGVGYVPVGNGRFRMFRSVLIPNHEAELIGRGEVPEDLVEALRAKGRAWGADSPGLVPSDGSIYRIRGEYLNRATGEFWPNALLYVGQTKRPALNRWEEHDRSPGKQGWIHTDAKVWYRESVPVEQLDLFERQAISGEPLARDGESDDELFGRVGQRFGEVPVYNELLRPDKVAPVRPGGSTRRRPAAGSRRRR